MDTVRQKDTPPVLAPEMYALVIALGEVNRGIIHDLRVGHRGYLMAFLRDIDDFPVIAAALKAATAGGTPDADAMYQALDYIGEYGLPAV